MISLPSGMTGTARRDAWHRPRSASCFSSEGSGGRELKVRPKSWETLRGRERFGTCGEEEKKGESEGKMAFGGPREGRCSCCLLDMDWTRFSTYSFHNFEEEPWTRFQLLSRRQRKCVSNPNFSKPTFQNAKKVSDSERLLHKVKRSLRLLGFEPSEFGICCGGTKTAAKWKRKPRTPTFSTKIVQRSVSLDSLRAVVRRAWLDDRVDESHRSLLARAAYEEWYFAKERELRQKREEERKARERAKESIQEDFQRKKQKSEEEFQKWLYKKRWKKEEGGGSRLQKKNYEPSVKLAKTKDEVEEAFAKWKMAKDKELRRKKAERRKEEEKKEESEKQKAERKAVAEKAFQQWKSRLEENERWRNKKMEMKKMRHEIQEKRKIEEKSKISFQMWKVAKDREIKQRIKEFREAERTAKEERLAQMEERMYEAEQAFEDWLERVDSRRKKQCCPMSTYRKTLPWLPA